jgi:hypothetical protein
VCGRWRQSGGLRCVRQMAAERWFALCASAAATLARERQMVAGRQCALQLSAAATPVCTRQMAVQLSCVRLAAERRRALCASAAAPLARERQMVEGAAVRAAIECGRDARVYAADGGTAALRAACGGMPWGPLPPVASHLSKVLGPYAPSTVLYASRGVPDCYIHHHLNVRPGSSCICWVAPGHVLKQARSSTAPRQPLQVCVAQEQCIRFIIGGPVAVTTRRSPRGGGLGCACDMWADVKVAARPSSTALSHRHQQVPRAQIWTSRGGLDVWSRGGPVAVVTCRSPRGWTGLCV